LVESGFMEYMSFGVSILSNLSYYYTSATLENKQKILGSIFPEKLIFGENTYRTAEPNELIDLLINIDTDCNGCKIKKVAQKGDQFHSVIPMGLEPNELIYCYSICCKNQKVLTETWLKHWPFPSNSRHSK